jgi:isopenicillin N synthase-like dioxygenase
MSAYMDLPRPPVIDFSLFDAGDPWRDHVAAQIDWAATEFGFFSLIGHGVDGLADYGDGLQDHKSALTGLGHKLLAMIGRGLRLGDNYFVDHYTGSPSVSFLTVAELRTEHTDAGLLTLLHQNEDYSLQVKHQNLWLDAPMIPGSIICSVGARLTDLTNGRYRPASYRVASHTPRQQIFMPLSFDRSVTADVQFIAESRAAA